MAISRSFCRFVRFAFIAVCVVFAVPVYAATDTCAKGTYPIYAGGTLWHGCMPCPPGCYCPGSTNGASWYENTGNVTNWCLDRTKEASGNLKNIINDGFVKRCPSYYVYSEEGAASSTSECYVVIGEGYYVATPKNAAVPCPSDKTCPRHRVYYGQISQIQDKYYGTISLDNDNGCCEFSGQSVLYAAANSGGKYVLYADGATTKKLSTSSTYTELVCSCGGNEAFVGMYDVNNKKRMTKRRMNNRDYLILSNGSNSYDLSTLFPVGNTSTWTAKYAKAYTVTLDKTNGGGGTDQFKVFDGTAYIGNFNIDSDSNTELTSITPPSSSGYQFVGYYTDNSVQVINADGTKTDNFDSVVQNIKSNQTWRARWEQAYTIYLNPNNNGGTAEPKYTVFQGNLYKYNKLSDADKIKIVTDTNAVAMQQTCSPKLTSFPTYDEDHGFKGYYLEDDLMFNSDGCPTVKFSSMVRSMNSDMYLTAEYRIYYTITLNGGCSSNDVGCITKLQIRDNGDAYIFKRIGSDGNEEKVNLNPGQKVENLSNVIPKWVPTADNPAATFEGYSSSDSQMVTRDGVFTEYGKDTMKNLTTGRTWTANWYACNTESYFWNKANNSCDSIGKGQYLDAVANKIKPCPGAVADNGKFSANKLFETYGVSVEKEWYEFTTVSKIDSLDIERCAIRYNPAIDANNKGNCGTSTKIIYTWDKMDGSYKLLTEDVHLADGEQSSFGSFTPETELTNENVAIVEADYCDTCDANSFQIEGRGCGFCNDGYCVKGDGDNRQCILCPAGSYCPKCPGGTGCPEEDGNLSCTNTELYCGVDQYSMEGATTCSNCAEGYSTENSKPNTNGLCLATTLLGDKGSGKRCTTSRACLRIPPFLMKPYTDSTYCQGSSEIDEKYVKSMSKLSMRMYCNRSFGLGNGIQTLRTYNDSFKTVKAKQSGIPLNPKQ